MWHIAWLLKGRHHHPNPKQEEGRGEDCNSTCVLTRHTILNLRNRNYSNGGMYCTCHTRERKEKRLMKKEQTPGTIGFENYSHDMKRRLRTIQGYYSSHVV